MKKLFNLVLAVGAVLIAPAAASGQERAWTIYAEDGQFLGYLIADRYHSESICNPYGTYGSDYSDSIFNRYGTYGSEYSQEAELLTLMVEERQEFLTQEVAPNTELQ